MKYISNERWVSLGSALLVLGDFVGPEFLYISKSITLEYLVYKIESL